MRASSVHPDEVLLTKNLIAEIVHSLYDVHKKKERFLKGKQKTTRKLIITFKVISNNIF